ncbi:hypothetical protein CEXT_159891 [Caerostris extrusa]|uniref:Uncharacterized protein n=1 Tax=Caerostris extrusa TaxID=172846 RepID=A0AAV4TQU4_CAEEX|nr:hypothetical protein CEXT_159891 [Caerostris extrusa]
MELSRINLRKKIALIAFTDLGSLSIGKTVGVLEKMDLCQKVDIKLNRILSRHLSGHPEKRREVVVDPMGKREIKGTKVMTGIRGKVPSFSGGEGGWVQWDGEMTFPQLRIGFAREDVYPFRSGELSSLS